MDNTNMNGSSCSISGHDHKGCWSKVIKGMIVGGIIFYAVNAISWTMLPWHMETINSFSNEKRISQVLNDTTTIDGQYMLPAPVKADAAAKDAKVAVQKPYAFVTIIKDGVDSSKMGNQVLSHILLSLALGGLLTCVLKHLAPGVCPVKTSAKIGLISALIATAPSVIWFRFPAYPAFLNGLDIFVSITLAGLAIAMFALRQPLCPKSHCGS